MITIKKIILLSLLLFFLGSHGIAFAEDNSVASIDLKLTRYEKECGEYIKYIQGLRVYKLSKKTADTVKKKTCHEINYSKYKLTSRLKVSNFLPYGEITLTGSAWHRCNLKFYPIEERIIFQLEINF
ncbi:hypothetical protein KAU19_07505 [Candidatus Parcubacteria bacterium]|nr:hypothetical protein [Candidatus Parcubacteria bacterium]